AAPLGQRFEVRLPRLDRRHHRPILAKQPLDRLTRRRPVDRLVDGDPYRRSGPEILRHVQLLQCSNQEGEKYIDRPAPDKCTQIKTRYTRARLIACSSI